ncbi:type II toxin-antitoxin system HicB family antitoxin [Jiella sp. M17.18]|uniref:type II toxin-antitoxin system HicB family antitoxin n=1 Tax=Jiella sp. M17.18 TaxID=3234247 RepID=UPI0034DEDCEF
MTDYVALIHKDADSDFGVSFPDLPGCVTAGRDLDEARAMAEEALAFHVEGLLQEGQTLPRPSSLQSVMADRENRDGVAILVPAKPPATRIVRVNVTLPAADLEAIDAYARAHGMTRSGFLAAAARQKLRESA